MRVNQFIFILLGTFYIGVLAAFDAPLILYPVFGALHGFAFKGVASEEE